MELNRDRRICNTNKNQQTPICDNRTNGSNEAKRRRRRRVRSAIAGGFHSQRQAVQRRSSGRHDSTTISGFLRARRHRRTVLQPSEPNGDDTRTGIRRRRHWTANDAHWNDDNADRCRRWFIVKSSSLSGCGPVLCVRRRPYAHDPTGREGTPPVPVSLAPPCTATVDAAADDASTTRPPGGPFVCACVRLRMHACVRRAGACVRASGMSSVVYCLQFTRSHGVFFFCVPHRTVRHGRSAACYSPLQRRS